MGRSNVVREQSPSYRSGVSGDRSYPFRPTSATQLRVGDLVGIEANGRWGCLQVTDLFPRKRSILYLGLLDWDGLEPPTDQNVSGCALLDNRLTGIELFTVGMHLVNGNAPVVENGHPSNRQVFDVGTKHPVSGWLARVNSVRERLGAERLTLKQAMEPGAQS